jgi:hypothetical protein
MGSQSSEEISEGPRKKADESSTLGLGEVEAKENAEKEMTDNAGMKRKGGTMDEIQTMISAHKIEGKSLVLLQVICRSIYNKALEFWNLVDTCNPDIIIGMDSWLREEIGNAGIFRADFTTYRRNRYDRGGGMFICIKNNIVCSKLRVDNDFEIIAVEVKGSDPKCTWEITGIYRAPNEDIRVIEKFAARTGFLGKSTK